MEEFASYNYVYSPLDTRQHSDAPKEQFPDLYYDEVQGTLAHQSKSPFKRKRLTYDDLDSEVPTDEAVFVPENGMTDFTRYFSTNSFGPVRDSGSVSFLDIPAPQLSEMAATNHIDVPSFLDSTAEDSLFSGCGSSSAIAAETVPTLATILRSPSAPRYKTVRQPLSTCSNISPMLGRTRSGNFSCS